MNITVPPDVSIKKLDLEGCHGYVVRHSELGLLGRLVIQALPDGQSYLSIELAGDPDDPMTAQRKMILDPLCEQIANAMEATLGKGSLGDAVPPVIPPSPTEVVESKLIPCERCGIDAAMLIFADNATTPGGFEDCARKMFHKYTKLDVPTWIIGPPIGKLAQSQTPTQVMKVWPVREAIVTTTADEFNEELDALLDSHCA